MEAPEVRELHNPMERQEEYCPPPYEPLHSDSQ